jgi:hypothetical protein
MPIISSIFGGCTSNDAVAPIVNNLKAELDALKERINRIEIQNDGFRDDILEIKTDIRFIRLFLQQKPSQLP